MSEETADVLNNEVKSQEVPSLDTLESGYVVGIQPNGNLEFHVLGKEPGLIQLLGLHKYAEQRLALAVEVSEGIGNSLLAKGFKQLSQQLETVLGMLTNQAKSNLQIFSK